MDCIVKLCKMKYKVSVIIPIFGVEKFIGRCAETLMRQTLKEVQYIFVNDCTLDNSMCVLKNVLSLYPERLDSVVLVEHDINKGLPAARNSGMEVALGEYIFHCDSDDFVELDMLENLYNEAASKDADIVWCDWFLTFEKNERYMKQPKFTTSIDALRSMLSGTMKYNVWNKLVRRSLYVENHILFPSGHNQGEDMTMILLFAYADKISYLPKAFYHYVKMNSNAMSGIYSEKRLNELRFNVDRTIKTLETLYGDKFEKEYAFLKLEAKFPFLIIGGGRMYRLWKEWYPEADKYILDNTSISFRNRWLQWCASKGLFIVVRLYCCFVCRIIYGILYR